MCSPRLISHPDADGGIGAVEGEVRFLRRVDAGVHRVEECVVAIADADFGVLVLRTMSPANPPIFGTVTRRERVLRLLCARWID